MLHRANTVATRFEIFPQFFYSVFRLLHVMLVPKAIPTLLAKFPFMMKPLELVFELYVFALKHLHHPCKCANLYTFKMQTETYWCRWTSTNRIAKNVEHTITFMDTFLDMVLPISFLASPLQRWYSVSVNKILNYENI